MKNTRNFTQDPECVDSKFITEHKEMPWFCHFARMLTLCDDWHSKTCISRFRMFISFTSLISEGSNNVSNANTLDESARTTNHPIRISTLHALPSSPLIAIPLPWGDTRSEGLSRQLECSTKRCKPSRSSRLSDQPHEQSQLDTIDYVVYDADHCRQKGSRYPSPGGGGERTTNTSLEYLVSKSVP